MMPPHTIEVHPPSEADAAVIVLHGLGADGTDFLPLADEIDLAQVGPVRWVLPRAPVRPVTINGGYRMRAWYDILGSDLARREDEAGLRESAALVHALVDREIARGVPAGRIVLAGFSQGGAVTLQVGLRQTEPLAGLVVLSSYLPLAAQAAAERHEASRSVPIFMAHGTQDPVVPLARGTAARDQLQQLGYAVEWHEYPMPHSVCAEEVEAIAAFLRRVLA